MTICVYHNNTLYADRAGLMKSSPTYFVEIKKLFVSSCSRLAVAVSGSRENDNFVESNKFQLLRSYVLTLEIDPAVEKAQLPEELIAVFKGQHLLIMTKEYLFKLKDDTLSILDNSSIASVGTGGTPTAIALIAGKEIMEAIRIGVCSDVTTYLTDVDSIQRSQLQ